MDAIVLKGVAELVLIPKPMRFLKTEFESTVGCRNTNADATNVPFGVYIQCLSTVPPSP